MSVRVTVDILTGWYLEPLRSLIYNYLSSIVSYRYILVSRSLFRSSKFNVFLCFKPYQLFLAMSNNYDNEESFIGTSTPGPTRASALTSGSGMDTNGYSSPHPLMDPARFQRLVNTGGFSLQEPISREDAPAPTPNAPFATHPHVTVQTPTRVTVNGSYSATPGGTLRHATDDYRVDPLLKAARNVQQNFRDRKITTLPDLLTQWPDMKLQMQLLGPICGLIEGKIPQDQASPNEVIVAASLIQSMCSDVDAVNDYLYRWREGGEQINITEMFQALKEGLGGYDSDIGQQAMEDVRDLKYTGGSISLFLRDMDRLFRIASHGGENVPDKQKLQILRRKFNKHTSYSHVVLSDTHKTYREMCQAMKKLESEFNRSGTTVSTAKKVLVAEDIEQANVAQTTNERRKVYVFRGPCHHCGQIGHKARDCPTINQTESLCLVCKLPGHPTTDCIAKLCATIHNLQQNQGGAATAEARPVQQNTTYKQRSPYQPAKGYESTPSDTRVKRFAKVAYELDMPVSETDDTEGENDLNRKVISDDAYLVCVSPTESPISSPIDLLDSGANSTHITDTNRFDSLYATEKFLIQTADGKLVKSSGLKGQVGHITDVNYTPQFSHNLVSVSRLVDMGYNVGFDEGGAVVTDAKTRKICGTGVSKNGLYYINLQNLEPSQRLISKGRRPNEKYSSISLLANNVSPDPWSRWHFRLHLPKSSVLKLLESNVVDELDLKISDLKKEHLNCLSCALCQTDKQRKRLGFPYGKPEQTIGGQLVSDIWTLSENGVGGIMYCIGFIDTYSKFAHIFFMKQKSEATDKLLLLLELYRQHGYIIKRIHADNGSEYTAEESDLWRDVCRKNQIEYTYSPPYTPILNRKIERYWRMFGNLSKTRLYESKCPMIYWPYACRYTNYLQNMTKIVYKDGTAKTPHEIFFKRKANLRMVRRWGCVASANIDRSLRSKAEPKAVVGYFVDVDESNQTYLIYVPRTQKLYRSADCVFDELNMDLNNSSMIINDHRAANLLNPEPLRSQADINSPQRVESVTTQPSVHSQSQDDTPVKSTVPSVNSTPPCFVCSVPPSEEYDASSDGGTRVTHGVDQTDANTVGLSIPPTVSSPTISMNVDVSNPPTQPTPESPSSASNDIAMSDHHVLVGGSHQSHLNRCDFNFQPTSCQESLLYWEDPDETSTNLMEAVLGHTGKWSSPNLMCFQVRWKNSPLTTREKYQTIKYNPVFHAYLRENSHAELIVVDRNSLVSALSAYSGLKSAFLKVPDEFPGELVPDTADASTVQGYSDILNRTSYLDLEVFKNRGFFSSDLLDPTHFLQQETVINDEVYNKLPFSG